MDRSPPNPYIDLGLRDLWTAMNERAGELLESNKPISRRDTAYLLLAASFRVSTYSAHPNSPVKLVKEGSTISAAFWPVLEHMQRDARYHVLTHAIDTAGLPPTWINRVAERAIANDDELRQALARIDAEAKAAG